MSRRAIRGRRFTGGVPPLQPVIRYNFDAANLSKDGGNLVASVTDLGRTGLTISQGTPARKPLWIDNGSPNSLLDTIACDVDGVNIKTLQATPSAALFGAAQGYTVFLVFNRTAGSTTHSLAYYNTGAARGGWQLEFSSNLRSFQARTSAGTVKSFTFGTYTANTWEIWTIRNWGGGSDDVDSTTWCEARVNGTVTAITGSPWFWVPTTHAVLLGNPTATAGPTLRFAEYRAYSQYLTAPQCLDIERQLGTLYGITVA